MIVCSIVNNLGKQYNIYTSVCTLEIANGILKTSLKMLLVLDFLCFSNWELILLINVPFPYKCDMCTLLVL